MYIHMYTYLYVYIYICTLYICIYYVHQSPEGWGPAQLCTVQTSKRIDEPIAVCSQCCFSWCLLRTGHWWHQPLMEELMKLANKRRMDWPVFISNNFWSGCCSLHSYTHISWWTHSSFISIGLVERTKPDQVGVLMISNKTKVPIPAVSSQEFPQWPSPCWHRKSAEIYLAWWSQFNIYHIYIYIYIYIHLKVPSETRYWSRSRSFLFSTAKPMLSQCHLQSSGLLWVVTVWHVHSPRPVSPLVSYLELQAGTCSAGITRPLT